jgi:hypothetical protein
MVWGRLLDLGLPIEVRELPAYLAALDRLLAGTALHPAESWPAPPQRANDADPPGVDAPGGLPLSRRAMLARPTKPSRYEARSPHDLTVALATSADPRDRRAYSGWPASLVDGLTSLVGRAIVLNGRLPQRLEFGAKLAGVVPRLRPSDRRAPRQAVGSKMPPACLFGRPIVWARSASLRRQLRRENAIDGCIAWEPSSRSRARCRSSRSRTRL